PGAPRRRHGRDAPEADADAAADPTLHTGEPRRAAQPVGNRPGCDRPHAVAEEPEQGEAEPEREHLHPGVLRVWVDELREEREDEDDRLRIRQVDEHALRVRPPPRAWHGLLAGRL